MPIDIQIQPQRFEQAALKKPRHKHRLRALRLARKRALRSKNRYVRQTGPRINVADQLIREDSPPRARIPLYVPVIFSLSLNYAETVALIASLRSLAFEHYLHVDLIFDKVLAMEPAATLALAAEIYRCRNLRKKSGELAVNGTYPEDAGVYHQLERMGFFRLLSIKSNPPALPKLKEAKSGRLPLAVVPPVEKPLSRSPIYKLVRDEAETLLPFVTNVEVAPTVVGEFVNGLVKRIHDVIPMDEASSRYLYAAIIEVTKNSFEHAYKQMLPQDSMRRWWLTAGVDRANKEVSIVVYDQGVGIPNTLEPELQDRVTSIIKLEGINPSDSRLIQIATREGVTSTNQAGRGMGFRTMRKFVDYCDDGSLLVFSNRGQYIYTKKSTDRQDQDRSLGGTLIQFRISHRSSVVSIGL